MISSRMFDEGCGHLLLETATIRLPAFTAAVLDPTPIPTGSSAYRATFAKPRILSSYKNSVRNSSVISISNLLKLKSPRMNTSKKMTVGVAHAFLGTEPIIRPEWLVPNDPPRAESEDLSGVNVSDVTYSRRKEAKQNEQFWTNRVGGAFQNWSSFPNWNATFALVASRGCSRAVLMLLFLACSEAVLQDEGACPYPQTGAWFFPKPGATNTRYSS
jgi:hypothetical protein